MQHKPFQPLQLGGEGGRQLGRDTQALGQLGQHGDPHREVEPVQQVLGLRVEVVGQLADVFAAVGEEGDLLVGLHPLGGKHFEQSPFGFGRIPTVDANRYPADQRRLVSAAVPVLLRRTGVTRSRSRAESSTRIGTNSRVG